MLKRKKKMKKKKPQNNIEYTVGYKDANERMFKCS